MTGSTKLASGAEVVDVTGHAVLPGVRNSLQPGNLDGIAVELRTPHTTPVLDGADFDVAAHPVFPSRGADVDGMCAPPARGPRCRRLLPGDVAGTGDVGQTFRPGGLGWGDRFARPVEGHCPATRQRHLKSAPVCLP